MAKKTKRGSNKKQKKKNNKVNAAAKKKAAAQAVIRERALKNIVHNAATSSDGVTPRDVLADFAPFKVYKTGNATTKDGEVQQFEAQIDFFAATTLPHHLLQGCFDLLKLNMQAMYEASADWGWDDKKKMAELTHPDARFLVATIPTTQKDSDSVDEPSSTQDETIQRKVCAFVHFRFCIEGEDPVLYVWEIQVGAAARRKGLGKRLAQLSELIARKNGMEWVMLTVFTDNTDAMKFYERLGYEPDETSPCMQDDADGSSTYEIYSKFLGASPALSESALAAGALTGSTKDPSGNAATVPQKEEKAVHVDSTQKSGP